MAEKDKIMDEKKKRKQEQKAHNKAARKTYREDHPFGWRLNKFIKNLIRKNK
jgi:hypothetical protein